MKKWFNKIKFDFWFFAKLGIFVLFLFFLVYPFINMFLKSFTSINGSFSLEYFKIFAEYKYYYQTLWNSLNVSITSTVLSILIGVPLAYIMNRYNVWGKKIINILIIMSLMSPPFIGAYSWILLLGRNGSIVQFLENLGIIIPSIYGYTGIIIVFTLKLYPYVYLYVNAALGSIDASLEEAAENLGSSKLKRILNITFPVILPTIFSGAIMVFMSALADFGTPILIGEGYKVLPVLVYEEYISEIGGNIGMSSAMSIIIIGLSLIVLLLQKSYESRRRYAMNAIRPPAITKLKTIPKILTTLLIFSLVFISILPQIVVIYTSFLKTSGPIFVKGFSFASYQAVFNRLGTTITNTFLYSSIAIIFVIAIGIIISYMMVLRPSKSSRLLDIFVMFPYVIPSAINGIAFLLVFNRSPFFFAGTSGILIIAYIIRKLPFTVRSSSAILQQIEPSIEDASISLGVPPVKSFFTVTARLMLPGIISGAILSWIAIINELGASIMLYTGRTSTMAVAIYTEVVRNSLGTAAALASILTLVTISAFLVSSLIFKSKTPIL
jgi:iron(III) transport system permease protein